MKVPFIIYGDLESLLEKLNTCHNDPKKSSTTKINKHAQSDFSLFTHYSFDTTKNKFDYYRSKSCMKNFFLDLREDGTKIINYEKEEMIPLAEEEKEVDRKQKVCYIYKRDLILMMTIKKYHKVRDHCHYTGKYRGAAHNTCNVRYKTPKELPVVFHMVLHIIIIL